ncbi:hypothetical protein M501DRAFT_926913 [Patellaria atrata CBS 101060]|uniref:DUF3824 domain-containing protein n=1 Tax=Patellaria atrata CBS 101060 TaxID=1346257 RepID=A0A9P4SIS2_9PEZI|nr:hypothetical protein M501DRAFT_926913 [Patellaria atrata CBS 101060]
MSEYGYDNPPRRYRSTRARDREPEYVETTYVERGTGRPPQDLAYRPREDSIEDIPRDFPPPGADYRRSGYGGPARTRSVGRRDYYDDGYSDFAGSTRGPHNRYDDRDGYHSDYYDRPRHKERRKSKVGEVLEDLGLGGVAGAIIGKNRSRSHSRHRGGGRHDDDYSDRDRSRDRGHGARTERKWQQAAQAALVAGAVEAFRSRKEPGPWTGEKGTRIATAALGAAGIDGLVDRDPNKKSKRHLAESVIGGLAANRIANGSRSQSRSRGRSRSRSRSRSIFGRSKSRGRSRSSSSSGGGGLGKLAGAGAIAAAGKALYSRYRSKSRRRSHSRDSSVDSFVPSRGRRYDRPRSGPDTEYDGPSRDIGGGVGTAAGAGAVAAADKKRSNSSSSESTTDIEMRRRKMRGKELLTAGLATVATVHAAHGVYGSMVASEKRRKLLSEGEISPEEARKAKTKNMLQDAAAIGIAALGIKSAFGEWKEMNEQRHEVQDLEKRRRKRKKERERREREARQQPMMMMMNGPANPYGGYPAQSFGGGPSTYADANPYGGVGGQLPPPPMGAPPGRY